MRALVIPLSYLLCSKSVFGIPIVVTATSFLIVRFYFGSKYFDMKKDSRRFIRNAELVQKTKRESKIKTSGRGISGGFVK